jgi:RNA polymerase sigma-70 factor (ECF subfamily)
VTALLVAWGGGDQAALDQLTPLVRAELQRLAGRRIGGDHAGHSLKPSVLVNEAYLRLIEIRQMSWRNRAHFFAMSGRLMRRILVDHARSRQYLKRGGGAQGVSLDDALTVCHEKGRDILALDDALTALAAVDARKSEVVELRFFGGLSVAEMAEALHISPETVRHDWKVAKVWLLRALDGAPRMPPERWQE